MAKRTKKTRFLKVAVFFVLLQAIVYVWVHLILSSIAGIEIAPTTSVAFLSFCGVEGISTAAIKICEEKTKTKTDVEG